jgi:solute:Na+ symporter, SSS family
MTHFDWLVDGSLVGTYLLVTMVAGLWVRRYVGKVEDFLVAGREMNVYLGVASLAATEFGIITCMYTAQAGYKYGFAGATPGICQALAMLVIGITGFCIKPLRESGVMTLPELFERQFGRGVRRAAGVVIVLGGLLNMGVFLRIGGEFLVLVTGFDAAWLEIVMTALLVMVAAYTILGGMLSVLVTDFLQFVVMSVGLIAVTVLVFWKIGFGTLVDTVETRVGPGGFNPFVHEELGPSYVVFQLLLNTAATLTWQTVIARVLASKDAATGRKVFTRTSFFFVCRFLIPGVWGIAALATLAPAVYSGLPAGIAGEPSLYGMPLFLSTFVPIGLMGLLVAAMLAADMSTDSSYMLTWASVIYNDVVAPFRRPGWTEKKGLVLNRAIAAAIGVFLLFYGLWYELEGNLWDYLTITGTIYLSSISVLLIAACYWKRANDWGAVAAICAGAAFPVAFLVLQKLPWTAGFAGDVGPYRSGILAFAFAALGMVAGSLVKPAARTR